MPKLFKALQRVLKGWEYIPVHYTHNTKLHLVIYILLTVFLHSLSRYADLLKASFYLYYYFIASTPIFLSPVRVWMEHHCMWESVKKEVGEKKGRIFEQGSAPASRWLGPKLCFWRERKREVDRRERASTTCPVLIGLNI